MGTKLFRPAIAALALGFGLATAPAHADSVERLQWLSTMTDKPGWGVQLAREQVARNELLEAIATLERVIAAYPGARDARIVHAGLLCRVDDPEGAAMEFALLHKQDFSDELWAEAQAACPGGQAGGK